MAEGLTFAIHPDVEPISVGLFSKAIENIHRLLRDIDYAMTSGRPSRRGWVISELHYSVPTVTVRPLLELNEPINVIANGLRLVTLGATEPPEYFTEDALDDLKLMRRLFVGRDRVKAISLSSDHAEIATIMGDIVDKAEKILTGGYWNLGSLEGPLEAINLHGVPTFTIWDRVSKAPVKCSFPQETTWKEKVKYLLERRVLVRGRIRYFRNGIPRSISNIEAIEDASPDADLPKATFGAIPNSEMAKDPVGFLSSKRRLKRSS